LNFSSSESFVRALGGGQWLNGDVSRKVDSRERPALYRPSIHPTRSSSTPARTRTRECAVLYRREKIYTWQREREREREGYVRGSVGVVQHLEYLSGSTATSRFRHGDPLLPIINGRLAWTSRFSLQVGINSSLVPVSKVISASSVLGRSSINSYHTHNSIVR
jgi:hypothetical protein